MTADRSCDVQVSVVSFREISLRFALKKLELEGITPEELPNAAHDMGISVCPLDPADAASFHRLPRTNHRDPFDRMLVWQCLRRGSTLVSGDREIRQYQEYGPRIAW